MGCCSMWRASTFISIPLSCWTTNQDGGREMRAKGWPTAHIDQGQAFLLIVYFFFFHSLPLLVCEDGQLVFVPDTWVSMFFNLGHGPGAWVKAHTCLDCVWSNRADSTHLFLLWALSLSLYPFSCFFYSILSQPQVTLLGIGWGWISGLPPDFLLQWWPLPRFRRAGVVVVTEEPVPALHWWSCVFSKYGISVFELNCVSSLVSTTWYSIFSRSGDTVLLFFCETKGRTSCRVRIRNNCNKGLRFPSLKCPRLSNSNSSSTPLLGRWRPAMGHGSLCGCILRHVFRSRGHGELPCEDPSGPGGNSSVHPSGSRGCFPG